MNKIPIFYPEVSGPNSKRKKSNIKNPNSNSDLSKYWNLDFFILPEFKNWNLGFKFWNLFFYWNLVPKLRDKILEFHSSDNNRKGYSLQVAFPFLF